MNKSMGLAPKLRYGKWTVLRPSNKLCSGKPAWHCKCDCGTRRLVQAATLLEGRSRSCGCIRTAQLKALAAKRVVGCKARTAGTMEYFAGRSWTVLAAKNPAFSRAEFLTWCAAQWTTLAPLFTELERPSLRLRGNKTLEDLEIKVVKRPRKLLLPVASGLPMGACCKT